MRNKSIKITTV